MVYDGYEFKKSSTIIALPHSYSEKKNKPNYVFFGRKCKKGDVGAVPAGYYHNGEYAIPLPCDGHSLTNMMFCGDFLVLQYEGCTYTTKFRE